MRQKIRKGKLEALQISMEKKRITAEKGFRINVRRELYKSALN